MQWTAQRQVWLWVVRVRRPRSMRLEDRDRPRTINRATLLVSRHHDKVLKSKEVAKK